MYPALFVQCTFTYQETILQLFQKCVTVADTRDGDASWIETSMKRKVLMQDSGGERPLIEKLVNGDHV